MLSPTRVDGWRPEFRGLAKVAAVAGACVTGAAAFGALTRAEELGVELREPVPGTLTFAGEILLNNLGVLGLVVAATALRSVVRLDGGDGSSSRVVGALCDATVGSVVLLNAIHVGAVGGALGLELLPRVAAHAPLELGGFALGVLLYLRERRVGLRKQDARALIAAALGLLIPAAFVESYVSGALLR